MKGNPFEELAERYDAWFEEEGKLIFPTELSALRRAAEGLPRPWLEVGVGSGRFAASLGIDVGLDPAERLLEMARRRGMAVVRGRGEALPFPAESFGGVFLIVTLCFVEEPSAVLRECRRVLREGGGLVVGLVPAESPWGRRYTALGKEGHPFYSRARFYTVAEVKKLLSAAGFSLERCYSTLYQPPGDVRHVEKPREGCDPQAGFVVFLARRTPGGREIQG